MRIRIVSDGRVLEGTTEQTMQQLQNLAFGKEEATLAEYVDWLAAQVARRARLRANRVVTKGHELCRRTSIYRGKCRAPFCSRGSSGQKDRVSQGTG